jgi:hypothetical protein
MSGVSAGKSTLHRHEHTCLPDIAYGPSTGAAGVGREEALPKVTCRRPRSTAVGRREGVGGGLRCMPRTDGLANQGAGRILPKCLTQESWAKTLCQSRGED